MLYQLKHLEACTIDGIRTESYQVGAGRWTCVSYLEHTAVLSFVTAQHPSREAAITRMAVRLADYFNHDVLPMLRHDLRTTGDHVRVADRGMMPHPPMRSVRDGGRNARPP
jgi:hypothetical protein